MAAGTKLGDLYFDVVLKDKTEATIKDIKRQLASLKINIGDGSEERKRIKTALSKPFKIGIIVDKADASKAVQAALNKANITPSVSITAGQKRFLDLQSKIADRRLITEQKILNLQQREAELAARREAAETRAAAAQAAASSRQSSGSFSMASFRGSGTKGVEDGLLSQIGLLQQAKEYALQYFNVYAGVNFAKRMAEVTGEFEKQLITLKAILQSSAQAQQLFNQIKQLSVVSPFTFMDLTSFAKQLSAYQIPANELYDTTKRLSDLSAGLGVDMSRIVLAYGQVRSAAFLRGQELRQFTEAGIPMVGALADKFSELEGRVVSTGEVFEKISNREVPFEMVKEVIDGLTNTGGKFYMMQEKQSESLAGKIANLSDAYDIMRYQIGSSNGVLKGSVELMTSLMTHYKEVEAALLGIGAAYATFKGMAFIKGGGFRYGFTQDIGSMKNTNAENLKSLALKKNLTDTQLLAKAELEQAAAEGRITNEQARQLITTRNLTKAKIAGAAASGQLSKADAAVLRAELANIEASKKSAGGWFASIKGQAAQLGTALSGMFKGLAVGAAVGLAFDLVKTMYDAYDAASKFNEELAKTGNDTAKDASKALEDLNGQYKMLLDGTLGSGEQQKLLDKYIEQIRNISPSSEDIVTTLRYGDSFATVADRVKAARQTLVDFEIAAAKIGKGKIDLDLGKDIGFFSDNLRERLDRTERDITNAINHSRRFNGNHGWEVMADASVRVGMENLSKSIKETTNNFAGMNEAGKNAWLDIAAAQIKASDMMQGASEQAIDHLMIRFDMMMRDGDSKYKSFIASVVKGLKGMPKARDVFAEYDGKTDLGAEGKKMLDETVKGILAYLPEQRAGIQAWLAQNPLVLRMNIAAAFNGDAAAPGAVMSQAFANYKKKGGLMDFKGFAKYYKGVIDETSESFSESIKGIKERYKNAESEFKSAAGSGFNKSSEKEIMAKAKSMAALLNASVEDKTTGSKKKGTGKGKSSGDEYIKKLREELRKYEQANTLITNLSKVMTESEAKKQVLAMKGNEGLDASLLGTGNKDSLLGSFLAKARKRNSEDAKKYVDELQGQLNTDLADKTVKALNDTLAVMKKRLDLTLSNFKLFDTLRSKTGDVGFATLFSFGRDGKFYESAVKAQIATLNKILAQEGGNLDYGSLVKMTAEQLQKALSDNEISQTAVKMFEEIQKNIDDKRGELAKQMADAMAKVLTSAEKIAQKRSAASAQIQNWLDLSVNKGVLTRKEADAIGMDAFDENALERWLAAFKGVDGKEAVIRAIQGAMKDLADETGKLSDEVFELSDAYDKLFNNGDSDSARTIGKISAWLDKILKSAKKNGKNSMSITVPGIGGAGDKTYTITNSMYRKLSRLSKDYASKLRKSNPFKALKEAREAYNKAKESGDDIEASRQMDLQMEALDGIKDLAVSAGKAVGQIFSAFSDDDSAKTIEDLSSMVESLGSIIGGIASKNWGSVASGVGGLVTSIVSLVNGDAGADKRIKKWQQDANVLKGLYDDIARHINRSLGPLRTGDRTHSSQYDDALQYLIEKYTNRAKKAREIYEKLGNDASWKAEADYYDNLTKQAKILKSGSGNPYQDQLASLQLQREAVNNQLTQENGKKNKDKDAIQSYREQLAALDDQIRYFAEDTLKELYSIDLKDWADQISDSLVSAFASGEDAAKAFDDTVGDIMNSVVKKMISLNVIQPALQNLQTYLFGADGKSGAFGADYDLSDDDVAGMSSYMLDLKNRIGASKELWDKINEAFGGILKNGNDASSTLGSGIKTITESTADILASYINAIRADVSIMRSIEEGLSGSGGVAQMQLLALNQIQVNTRVSADNSTEIMSLLKSVMVASSGGYRVRV